MLRHHCKTVGEEKQTQKHTKPMPLLKVIKTADPFRRCFSFSFKSKIRTGLTPFYKSLMSKKSNPWIETIFTWKGLRQALFKNKWHSPVLKLNNLPLRLSPKLTWRDVQHIIVESSQVTSPLDEGWKTNGAGKRYNHKFGFGRLDVSKMVDKALKWKTVDKQRICHGAAHNTTRFVECFKFLDPVDLG